MIFPFYGLRTLSASDCFLVRDVLLKENRKNDQTLTPNRRARVSDRKLRA